jgi:hypothetical protein
MGTLQKNKQTKPRSKKRRAAAMAAWRGVNANDDSIVEGILLD